MRRRQKRVANLAQESLPFPVADGAAPRRSGTDARFIDDSPYQLWLGPQRLDDYLNGHGLGSVVRLRREIERLDYTDLVVAYQASGRRPYHPRTLLGLILYGILHGQWSLRGLEELAVRDLGAWWICGGLQPDHSTIGDFINRHSGVLSQEFVLKLLRSLVGRLHLKPGVVAGDGTVVEAAASHYRTIKAEAAKQAADKARAAAEAEPENERARAAAERAQEVAEVAEQRTERRERQGKPTENVRVSPQEPEAVLQPRKDGATRLAYKPSMLVHESGLVVGQVVHPSSETAVVAELLDQHVAVFGANPTTALLDAGYCQAALLKDMVERDVNVLCPSGKATEEENWQRRGPRGRFGKHAFEYHEERNVYRCPAAGELRQTGRARDGDGRLYRTYATKACANCALRAQCTTSGKGRKVKRYDGEEYKEAMALVLSQPAARRQYGVRRTLGERSFAIFREQQGLRRFHRYGLAGARVEFALHVMAFDLKWALNRFAAGTATAGSDRHTAVVALLWARVAGPLAAWRPIALFGCVLT
jgi:transposase